MRVVTMNLICLSTHLRFSCISSTCIAACPTCPKRLRFHLSQVVSVDPLIVTVYISIVPLAIGSSMSYTLSLCCRGAQVRIILAVFSSTFSTVIIPFSASWECFIDPRSSATNKEGSVGNFCILFRSCETPVTAFLYLEYDVRDCQYTAVHVRPLGQDDPGQ